MTSTRSLSARLADAVADRPKMVVLVVLVVTLLFGFCARNVRLDNNFAALFASDTPEARVREDYRKQWGPDDGLLVAVVHADRISPELITLVERATGEATRIPAVAHVNSVTSVDVVTRTPAGAPMVGPVFGSASPYPGTMDQRIALARASKLGDANLISADGSTLLIVGELRPENDSYERVVGPADEFRSTVERAVAESNAGPVSVNFAGVAYTRVAAIQQMQGDLLRLSPLATLLVGLILFLVFRRVAAVVAPMLAIGAATIVTAGVIGLFGDNLNQVTIIYPILLMGVVVSSATHLVHRFYRERAAGASAAEAGRRTVGNLTRAAFVAALTTAVGFASLAIAQMQILHEFGLYLALGVVAAFAIECTLIPAVLVWSNSKPSARYLEGRPHASIGSALRGSVVTVRSVTRTEWFARTVSKPRVAGIVLLIGLLVCIASLLVARTAQYDYALSNSLSASHPITRGNEIIDRDLAGIIPIEIGFEGAPGDFRRADNAERLDELATWLEQNDGMHVMGLPALMHDEVAALTPSSAIPTDDARFDQLLDLAGEYRHGDYLHAIVSPDFARTRLRGFTPDTGGNAIVALRARFEAEATRVMAGTGIVVHVTGEAPVAYAGMNNLSRELVESTTLALVAIVLALLLVFRNGWLAMIGVLPNVAPVLVGLALYRLTNEVLDPLPGVVFCIAMGLAADDTIHLINRWNELRRDPSIPSAREALVQALLSVRKAMVASSAILIAGFLALTLSGFAWNRELGWLGSFVLLLALASDLLFGTAGIAVYAGVIDRRNARRTPSSAVIDLRENRAESTPADSLISAGA